jgi:hypothetical protein
MGNGGRRSRTAAEPASPLTLSSHVPAGEVKKKKMRKVDTRVLALIARIKLFGFRMPLC